MENFPERRNDPLVNLQNNKTDNRYDMVNSVICSKNFYLTAIVLKTRWHAQIALFGHPRDAIVLEYCRGMC